jgi:hypothetical protein
VMKKRALLSLALVQPTISCALLYLAMLQPTDFGTLLPISQPAIRPAVIIITDYLLYRLSALISLAVIQSTI